MLLAGTNESWRNSWMTGCIFNAEAYEVSEFLGVLSGAAAKV